MTENWVGNLALEQVNKLVGDKRYQTALAHMDQGRLSACISFPDGSIGARWTDWQNRYEMKIGNLDQGIGVSCTCRQSRSGVVCDHLVALMVNWVTAPEDFGTLEDQAPPAFEPPLDSTAAHVNPSLDAVQEYHDLLRDCTVQRLREIARLRGVTIVGVRKEAIVETLAKALADAADFKTVWENLSPDARLVLGLFGFCQLAWGIAMFETITKTSREFANLPSERTVAAVNSLRQLGLVFGEDEDGIKCPGSVLARLPTIPNFIPLFPGKPARYKEVSRPQQFSECFILLLLFLQAGADQFRGRQVETHPLEAKLPDLRGWPHDSKELIALSRERNPSQALWSYKLRLTPLPPLLADEANRQLVDRLHISQDQLDFMLRLAFKTGCVVVKPGKQIEIYPEKISDLVKGGTGERIFQLINLYFALDTWTELDLAVRADPALALRRIPGYRGAYNQMLQSLLEARHSLILLLRRIPVGQWVDFSSMVKQAGGLPLTRSHWTSARFWFLELKGQTLRPEKPDGWQEVYSRFSEAVITGPLHWLGLVDLAWQNDKFVAFRLTKLWSAVLHGMPVQLIHKEGRTPILQFTEKGGLLLHPETASNSLVHLWLLLGSAKVMKGGELVIQPDIVGYGRAFTAGWTVEQITQVLEEAAHQPLPPSLAESLRTWWDNFGKVSLYQDVALIEFSDDYALPELLAGTSLSQNLLYQFGPRLAAIRPESAQVLYEELARKGYTPKMQG